MLLVLLAACDGDQNLNAGKPILELSAASIDFGEVVVGQQRAAIGIALGNGGYGDLEISDVAFADGTPADFSVEEWPQEGIGYGDEGVLVIGYTPDAEGGDAGTVVLTTNMTDKPTVEVPVEGIGVIPKIDVDPEVLYFGRVDPGGSVTLPVWIGAGGSGDLRLTHVGFSEAEALAYALDLPESWAEPYTVANGTSFRMDVTFAPPDTEEWRGEVWLESNDPEDPVAVIALIGNTDDVPTEPQAPIVEILDPNNGEFFLDDMDVALVGYVVDTDEPNVENLLCGWYAGTDRVANAFPTADGRVEATSRLDAGNVDLTLRCYDSTGEVGEDTVTVTVWPADEPVEYTISGGSSVFDFFSVDDDLTVQINGVSVYEDTDHTKGTLAPLTFEAKRGDTIRLVAVDYNTCDAFLDPLVLHWGTGESQDLNEGVCLTSCPEHACYDGTYNGPWPGVVLDQEFEIAIP